MQNRLYFNSHIDSADYLYSQVVEEQKSIGYYQLPKQNIEPILEFIQNFNREIENIFIVGIGGSSLGTEAIYNFLKPKRRKILFLDTTDPIYIEETLKGIDFKKSHFFIISKSGSTVETIAIFKYLYSINSDKSLYTFITDRDSKLNIFAESIGSKLFYIPSNVGGRFSVLSAVGLVPLGVVGVNIKALLDGAESIYRGFINRDDIFYKLIEKAEFYFKNRDKITINGLFAYSNSLNSFIKWYIQLWAESLGKELNGLTPIGLIGSKDQHSFLQLIVEGRRDKSITFIKIENIPSQIAVPDINLKFLDNSDILNGIPFKDLINLQADSTRDALINRGIAVDEILIDTIDEVSIGELIFYFELLTSLVGILLNINTYNQNGVEEGKQILRDRLRRLS